MKQNENSLKEAIQKETKGFEENYLWLESHMPEIFFQEVSHEEISLVVHALMGLKVQDFFSHIHLKNGAIILTLENSQADLQILKHFPLYGIRSYRTYLSKAPFPETNFSLRIAKVQFTEPFFPEKEVLEGALKANLQAYLQKTHPEITKEAAEALFSKIDAKFLRLLPPERQTTAIEVLYRAQNEDQCQYEIQKEEKWKEKESPSLYITLAWKNVPKHNFLYRLARLVYNHNLVMHRVNATYIDPYKKDSVLMLSFGLHGSKGENAERACDINEFISELVTLKYFGSSDIFDETFVQTKQISGNLANLLRTMRYFIHQMLVHLDPNLYSLANIEEGLCHHPELTVKLLSAFEAKFHIDTHNEEKFANTREEFYKLVNALDTGDEYQDTRRKNILLQGMSFIDHALKTNYYMRNKTALAFRLDPAFLDNVPFDRKKIFPELPYGIFFIKGMHFFGFHIRFKDLARGGLRTVFPDKKEKMFSEMNNVFLECYNLALTQNKKNKDIPEGGAKGVIFLKPYERLEEEAKILTRELVDAGFSKEIILEKVEEFRKEQKLEYMYQTQRAFVKSLLSLINCEPDGKLRADHIVDYLRKPEYIYLGPDENLHDILIDWIADESKRQNYKPKGAFISGKPKMGINHKEYGVTSLGVTVFMHEVLQFLGIDPRKDPFTVKMTGGPDGDVGGNMIVNLYRFYPQTAKLLALTDVSGTIYDPKGLDLEACLELFKAAKPIHKYPPGKLSEGGFLLDREKKKEITPFSFQTLLWRNVGGQIVADWLSSNEMNALYRNNVHTIKTDIFLPCGGRPRTLRDTNIHEFLDATQIPTSRAIIEGANLYLTPFARRALEEKGVVIVKDSSANKGGVITSSFEILAGLVLTDEEFIEHKTPLVNEILERVKLCAQNEAELLLKTHKETKEYLTDISEKISYRINMYTDQLLEYLQGITLSEDPLDPLTNTFLSYAPKILREKYEKRLLKEVPDNHKKAIIATAIASSVVYQRGLKWLPTIVDILPLLLSKKR